MTEEAYASTRPSVPIARSGEHVLMYNRVTRELFDRCGDAVSYVGRATGDTQRDVARWMRWMHVPQDRER